MIKRLVLVLIIFSSQFSLVFPSFSKINIFATVDDEIITNDNNVKCAKNSGSKVEWVEEESYFFKLSAWQDKLLKFYKDNPKFILPTSRKKFWHNFL